MDKKQGSSVMEVKQHYGEIIPITLSDSWPFLSYYIVVVKSINISDYIIFFIMISLFLDQNGSLEKQKCEYLRNKKKLKKESIAF